jgi:hypothetical protein
VTSSSVEELGMNVSDSSDDTEVRENVIRGNVSELAGADDVSTRWCRFVCDELWVSRFVAG